MRYFKFTIGVIGIWTKSGRNKTPWEDTEVEEYREIKGEAFAESRERLEEMIQENEVTGFDYEKEILSLQELPFPKKYEETEYIDFDKFAPVGPEGYY